jgi:hypothetical protein
MADWMIKNEHIRNIFLDDTGADIGAVAALLQTVLGENYHDLAIRSVSEPCYFAVRMDAIAMGRWFDATSVSSSSEQNDDDTTNDIGI